MPSGADSPVVLCFSKDWVYRAEVGGNDGSNRASFIMGEYVLADFLDFCTKYRNMKPAFIVTANRRRGKLAYEKMREEGRRLAQWV